MAQAIFGAGCFWGVQQAFDELEGVLETRVGYSGGTVENATYNQVCTGDTGHAEVVWLEFDPDKISYGQLLNNFWQIHDPTTWHRQGPDVGSQYRSVVFYMDENQKQLAEESKKALAQKLSKPILTEIEPYSFFVVAEDYHQKYYLQHPGCRI